MTRNIFQYVFNLNRLSFRCFNVHSVVYSSIISMIYFYTHFRKKKIVQSIRNVPTIQNVKWKKKKKLCVLHASSVTYCFYCCCCATDDGYAQKKLKKYIYIYDDDDGNVVVVVYTHFISAFISFFFFFFIFVVPMCHAIAIGLAMASIVCSVAAVYFVPKR